MLPERGPHNSGRHADISQMQSVHYDAVSGRSLKYAVIRHDHLSFALHFELVTGNDFKLFADLVACTYDTTSSDI